ncbi:MAG: hypothetical protein WBZ24_09000 [Anaerolineales bacterium]|jgi:hypothetical protein
MNPKWTLLFAGGLTAFVLVVVGAVAGRAAAQGANPIQEPTAIDPSIQAQLDQRDAAYQKTIDQANQQLEQAYQEIATLQAQVAPTATETSGSIEDSYPISAELAVGLALNLSPGAKLKKWPELVDFQGTVAWEVILDKGTMYLDATNAILLYNGTSSFNTSSGGGGGGGGGEHEGGEHEHNDD